LIQSGLLIFNNANKALCFPDTLVGIGTERSYVRVYNEFSVQKKSNDFLD